MIKLIRTKLCRNRDTDQTIRRGENYIARRQICTVSRKDKNVGEQFNGREGETATLYERRSLNFSLRVFGFAPRQFNRSTLSMNNSEVLRLRYDNDGSE